MASSEESTAAAVAAPSSAAIVSVSSSDWDLPAVPVDGDPEPPWARELTGEKAEVLRELAEWVREEKLPATSDANLVKFVHSCSYDLDKAKKCAKDFYWARKAVPEVFCDWDTSLPSIQSILDVTLVAVMPRRTPENFRVVVHSLRTSDTTKYVVADACRVSIMMLETIFLTEPTIDGVVVIHDLGNITFGHFVKFLWSVPRKINVYFEDGLPVKRERVHLVNCPSLVDKGLKLMSHIGRKEDWDRMRVYKGDDYSELHKMVPKDCLPSDLGGTLPSIEELHDVTVERLGAFKQVFRKQLEEIAAS